VAVSGANQQHHREADDGEPPAPASTGPAQRAPDAITTVRVQCFVSPDDFLGSVVSRWQSTGRPLILGVRTQSEVIEMSVDTPAEPDKPTISDKPPALRREALLPNERSRGLGTVAVVCTMAGVASGLALATTLMAMQVADSMTVRTCPYRV